MPHPDQRRLRQTVTLYGRKPVMEALQDTSLTLDKLHLASSNRENDDIRRMRMLAADRGIDIAEHEKRALSRISKNARQDQGVALDVHCPNMDGFADWLEASDLSEMRILAFDSLHNPQNLGMAIRSATAAGVDAMLMPRKGGTGLNPLTIKASAGVAFRAPLVHCESLPDAIRQLRERGVTVYGLEADCEQSLFSGSLKVPAAFVLGNETDGLSVELAKELDTRISIPMEHSVESLNVAVTAALVAYTICQNQ